MLLATQSADLKWHGSPWGLGFAAKGRIRAMARASRANHPGPPSVVWYQVSTLKEKEKLPGALQEEQRQVQREMDKMMDLYLADELPKEGFGRRYRPPEERGKQIDEQIPELQSEIDFLRIQYLPSDQILSDARDLYSRWPHLTADAKRRIAESIVERVVVGDGDVNISLCYLPSAEEMASRQRNVKGSSRRRP